MWQKGFESPHLYYYDPDNLVRLVDAHGFDLLDQFSLESVSLAGLWGRIRAGGQLGATAAGVVYLAAVIALPVLRLLPADIMVQVYRRR
jgi:hypothetical protein